MDQKKLDQRLSDLLQSAASAFDFAQDATLLGDKDDRLKSIHRTIVQLMDQIIECCLFIREIVRYNLLSKPSHCPSLLLARAHYPRTHLDTVRRC